MATPGRTVQQRIDAAEYSALGYTSESMANFQRVITEAFDAHDVPRSERREARASLTETKSLSDFNDAHGL